MRESILLPLAIILLFLPGCTTIPSKTLKESIDLSLLDGVWTGRITSDLATGQTRCNFNGPLLFKVQDGKVVSVGDGRYQVNSPIRSDGFITVTIPDVIRITRQETFTDYKVDLTFYGWLSESTEGRWESGPCHGDWNASLGYSSSEAMRKVDEFNRKNYENNRLPHSVLILMTDVIWEYGKKKFVVYEGDVLEVLSKKTCRSGSGECWKVRIKNSGIGYVRAMDMRSRHRLVFD